MVMGFFKLLRNTHVRDMVITTVRGIDDRHGVQQLDEMPRYNFI